MPVYLYKCPAHGVVEVAKPMAEASHPAFCDRCIAAAHEAGEPRVIPAMARSYRGLGYIIRPSGWNLRPGDRGYSDFSRELELGEVRQAPERGTQSIDASLLERPAPPKVEYSESHMRDLRNVGELVDRAIRESPDVPELWREGVL